MGKNLTEIYVQKVKKISDTISKRSLPAFDYTASNKTTTMKKAVSTKDMSSAQQDMEIDMMRGVPPEEIFAYDLCLKVNFLQNHKRHNSLPALRHSAHLDGQPVFSPNPGLLMDVMIDFM